MARISNFRRALLAAGVTLLLAPAVAQSAELPGDFFTMNGNSLIADGPLRDQHLRNIAATGVTAVRADVLWNVVENTPPSADGKRNYNWTSTDLFVAALSRAGLTWRPMFGNSPHWNRSVTGNVASAPADPAYAMDLAATLMRRYGPNGTLWTTYPTLAPRPVRWIEAWNEPNLSGSTNGVLRYPADTYAGFLRAVADGAHGVDPAAQVVVGGLVPYEDNSLRAENVQTFLTKVAAADPAVADRVDGVALHVYSSDPDVAMDTMGMLRDQLNATAFAGLPMHLNETGGHVKPVNLVLGEPARAAYLEAMAQRTAAASGASCGIASIAPYTWTTNEVDALNAQHWFGIANLDGSLKPSATSWAKGVAAATAGDTPCGTPPDRTAPAAATALRATAGDARVTLDWADNADADLAGYEVHRATVAGGPYTRLATATASAYVDTTAVNGTTYHYVVRATDTSGNLGAFSAAVSAKPVRVVAISLLGSVASNKTVTLRWSGALGTQVDVYRNGVRIRTTTNDGVDTDALSKNTRGTYVYKVCERASTTACSPNLTLKVG
jgi:hypothetical protein